jgi:hypothetical protein
MPDYHDLLTDRASGDYSLLPGHASVGDAASAGAAWVVVVDDAGQPIGAAEAAGLPARDPDLMLVEALHPAVLAEAQTPVDAVLGSPAFGAAPAAPEAVIALSGDEVVGVWGGQDLAAAAFDHASRFGQDTSLPGTIRIPRVVVVCRHRSGRRRCRGSLTFRQRPAQPPLCPDPDKLGPHPFQL